MPTNTNTLARALIAMDVLESRKKLLAKECNERIKRISRLADILKKNAVDPEMLNAEESIDPELLRLIDNPEEGL